MDSQLYLKWYGPDGGSTVGLLFSGFCWVNRNPGVDDELIRCLEKQGLDVITVFSYSMRDANIGARSLVEVVSGHFFGNGRSFIYALVTTVPFFLGQEPKNMGTCCGNRTCNEIGAV